MKSVQIGAFSGLHFLAFALSSERYEASLRIQSECGKIQTRETPYLDTFQAVISISIVSPCANIPQ